MQDQKFKRKTTQTLSVCATHMPIVNNECLHLFFEI